MASITLPSSFFTGLQDSSGNSPPLTTAGQYLTLHQRTTAPPSLPTLSSSVSINGDFFNLQETHPGNFSSTASGANGSPTLGNQGLTLGTADGLGLATSSDNSWCRSGTWWSEGILSFTPALSGGFKQLEADTFQGTLRLIQVNGSWRLQFLDGSGTANTFDSVTVPVTSNAPGSIPAPFYFRFLRELPTSGTGSYHLAVNDGATTQTQTITGAVQPINANPFVTTFGNGSGGTLKVYWYRGIGTNTKPTVGALQSSYWSTPAVFSAQSFYSHGTTSTADCGIDDRYWYELGLLPGGEFTGLIQDGGGLLKLRVAATNTAPTGSTSSLFSGAYETVQEVPAELSDPQGRYLATEWRWEPGTGWPLSSGSVHIRRDSTDFAQATHFADPQTIVLTPLPVPDEGSSQGTLPYQVEQAVGVDHARRVHRAQFSFPYSHSRPLGTASRRSYKVTWLLTESERDTLVAFFESRDGGEQAFSWTAPGDSSSSLVALASGLDIKQLAPGAFEIKATLVEVL